ncbi:hypothetical protein [Paenibacillus sp. NPDC093718]|uniref:hypothetical protein n=1 Tax=Paenibacillus sp. NPDC093718 TaxID=3390601 RepID=UPI003D065999
MHYHIYSTMIGKHFKDLDIQLLCAQIDQRILYGLPIFTLRHRLAERIRTFLDQLPVNSPKQEKTLKYMLRDMQTYPEENFSGVTISCKLRDGRQLIYNLKEETIMIGRAAPIPVYAKARHTAAGGFIRILTYELKPGDVQTITRDDILSSSNAALLSLIFHIHIIEAQLLASKMRELESFLLLADHEVEHLREKMGQFAPNFKSVEEDVLEVSQQLDEKIMEFIRMQQLLKGFKGGLPREPETPVEGMKECNAG